MDGHSLSRPEGANTFLQHFKQTVLSTVKHKQTTYFISKSKKNATYPAGHVQQQVRKICHWLVTGVYCLSQTQWQLRVQMQDFF